MEKLFESWKRRKLSIFWKMYNNYKHACPILTNISCQYLKLPDKEFIKSQTDITFYWIEPTE